jgi:predicted dehydrogenase
MRHLPVGHDEPLRAELIAFLRAVRSGSVPAVTGDEGVASLEIAIRCLESPARPAVNSSVAASPARKGPRRVVG